MCGRIPLGNMLLLPQEMTRPGAADPQHAHRELFRINVEAPPVDALLEAGQAIAAAVSRVAFNLPSRDLLAPGEGLPVIGQKTLKLVRLLRAFSQTTDTLLITGPSGTTDIEGSYVRGAHGPGFVHVILVAGEVR